MKSTKKVTGFLTALIVTMLFSNAIASDYLGEYCWLNEDSEIVRFAVTHIGGAHYSFDGCHIDSQGRIAAFNGNGVMVVDKLYGTFTGSESGAVLFVRGVLHLSTMSFDLEIFGIEQEFGNIELDYGTETLQYTSCP